MMSGLLAFGSSGTTEKYAASLYSSEPCDLSTRRASTLRLTNYLVMEVWTAIIGKCCPSVASNERLSAAQVLNSFNGGNRPICENLWGNGKQIHCI